MTNLQESSERLSRLLPATKHKNVFYKKRKNNKLTNLFEVFSLYNSSIQLIYDSQKSKRIAQKKIKEWVKKEDEYEIGVFFEKIDLKKFLNERIFRNKS